MLRIKLSLTHAESVSNNTLLTSRAVREVTVNLAHTRLWIVKFILHIRQLVLPPPAYVEQPRKAHLLLIVVFEACGSQKQSAPAGLNTWGTQYGTWSFLDQLVVFFKDGETQSSITLASYIIWSEASFLGLVRRTFRIWTLQFYCLVRTQKALHKTMNRYGLHHFSKHTPQPIAPEDTICTEDSSGVAPCLCVSCVTITSTELSILFLKKRNTQF